MEIRTTHTVVAGDSRRMGELADKSVHLVITSPPYWQLKDYGVKEQIGFHDSYEEYINHLNLVWMECYRVLHDGCRLCVNIGDQFARAVYYGRYKVIPIREEIIRFCETIGFDYMGAVIWQKVTTSKTTGGGVQMGSYPFPRNGILKLDYEFILVFKKLGDAPKPSLAQKEMARMTAEEWNTFFAGHWMFPGAKQDGHLAMFPEELPRRLIKMFSFPGENILDPFAGSGTTSLAAKHLGRSSVGYEINPEFIPIFIKKLGLQQTEISGTAYEFLQQTTKLDVPSELAKLPYLFADPHKLDKKVDLKKLNYGAKIDAQSNGKREDFFTVKEVISPEKVRLSNDLTIRLIGIRESPKANGAATKFLQDKTKGKRVFLRHDSKLYDTENVMLAYLYLENKTFVNAHLMKSGLVMLDDSIDFKYKSKFRVLFDTSYAHTS
jgi:site-specific DNA-methyltransferase (adenine-specific)